MAGAKGMGRAALSLAPLGWLLLLATPAQAQSVGGVDVQEVMAKLESDLGGLLGGGPGGIVGYVYMDRMGRRVQVTDLQEVPEDLRELAKPIHENAPPPSPDRAPGHDQIYKMKNPDGGEVYTNIVEQVPVAERDSARMDLSHVPLNSKLGTEINARLAAAHGALADSAYCQERREKGELVGRLASAWDAHAPLLICLGLLLLLFLASPFMIRQVGGAAWSRVLTMAAPALTIAGVMMWTMRSSNMAVVEFRQALTEPDPCSEEAFAAAGDKGGIGALADRFDLVKQLSEQLSGRLPEIDQRGIKP